MIKIITDSTCDIDKSLVEKYDLKVLPLKIIIQGQEYSDEVDIKIDEVYGAMREGIVPTTAQIGYKDIYDTFKQCCERGEDFIHISFSKEMSGCYSFTKSVAEEIKEQYPERKIMVIDSRCGSGALGIMVLQALRMVEAGYSFEKVVNQIEFMAQQVELIFTLSDLNWLAKGGRLSRTVGYVGTILNVRPLLEVEKGKIVATKMVRGSKKAVSMVAKEVAKRAANFPNQLISITHADDIEMALDIDKKLKELLPECITTISCIGAVLGVHLGIGGVGVYCFRERPECYMSK